MTFQIILAFIKLANIIFTFAQEQKWINEGQSIAVAKASAEILRKSNYAKQALEEFAAKSDDDIDDFLRKLEPGNSDSK